MVSWVNLVASFNQTVWMGGLYVYLIFSVYSVVYIQQ